jgi:hypothetical protein
MNLLDSKEYFGAKSAFVQDTKKQEDDPNLKGHKDADLRASDSTVVKNIIQDYANGFKKEEMDNLNNISNSIAVKNMKDASKMNNFTFNMVYNSLQKVQYISGYRDGYVADPIWTKLDKETVENMDGDSYLICRLKEAGSITKTKNAYTKSFSPYNQLFLIGSDPPYKTGVAATLPGDYGVAAPAGEGMGSSGTGAPIAGDLQRTFVAPVDIPVEYYRAPPSPVSDYSTGYTPGMRRTKTAPQAPAGPTRALGRQGSPSSTSRKTTTSAGSLRRTMGSSGRTPRGGSGGSRGGGY